MAGIRSILGKIGRALRGSKPKVPYVKPSGGSKPVREAIPPSIQDQVLQLTKNPLNSEQDLTGLPFLGSKPMQRAAIYGPAAAQFLLGHWTPMMSSNVQGAVYDPVKEILTIEFRTGATYEYPGIDVNTAYQFVIARSKGRWVWTELKRPNRPYSKIRDASRPPPPKRDVSKVPHYGGVRPKQGRKRRR